MKYTQEQSAFLKGLDFLRLGQAVNHEQWQSAAMILRRMEKTAKELDLCTFERQFTGLRQCINRKDKTQAKQVLAIIIQKRVQMLKQIAEEKEIAQEAFEVQ